MSKPNLFHSSALRPALQSLIGKKVFHKKSGKTGILDWSRSGFNETLGIRLSGGFLSVFHEDEVEVLEKHLVYYCG